MEGQKDGSGHVRVDARRRGKRRNSTSLYQVYPFEKAPGVASGSVQHDATATNNKSDTFLPESNLLPDPFDGTLDPPAALPEMVGSSARRYSKIRNITLPTQDVAATDSLYIAPSKLPTAAFSYDTSPSLDGMAIATTSYIPLLSPTPSSLINPQYARSFDADNPLHPFPPFRLPLLGQTTGVQEPQVINHDYQPNYPPITSEHNRSAASRRGWLQQQQLQQNQSGGLGADAPYSHTSLHPSRSANVPEQQRSASAFAAPSFSSGAGSSSAGHENSSMMGMTDASFASSQVGFDGQQAPYSDTSGQGQGTIGPISLQRAHDYRPGSSDTDSLASSEWSSLPNLRLMRGAHGDLLSSNTSASQMSTPSERGGKRKQSRAHLQKHLRTLQSEMVALKEKVRVAEDAYRETSPDDQSISDTSSSRLYDSHIGRKPLDHFDMRDYRGNERAAQSGNEAMVESSGSAYSSSYSGYPASAWRQHPYSGGPSQTASSTSSMGALPPRRGTWKTGAGNVLVFNTAVASDTEQSTSGQPRTASYSEQTNDDGDEDEDVGMGGGAGGGGASDDTGKRYQCLVPGCMKSFTTSGHARRHSRTHLGHKLFICPHEGCDSTFTRRDNCRQHQRARHHMTLPVPELTEGETLENLILDRQRSNSSQRANNTA